MLDALLNYAMDMDNEIEYMAMGDQEKALLVSVVICRQKASTPQNVLALMSLPSEAKHFQTGFKLC